MKMSEPIYLYARILSYPVLALLFILSSCGENRQSGATSSGIKTLISEGLRALNNAEGEKARAIGIELLDSTISRGKAGRITADIFGRIILGQSYILLDSAEKIYRPLHEAELICLRENNDSALTSVYNGLGMFALNYERDYAEALRHYFSGIEAAKRSSHARMHSLIMSNIAAVYLLEKDPHGINYAMECYYQGKKTNDTYLQYTGAITAANTYLNAGDCDMALKYASEAEVLLHADNINDRSLLYATLGRAMQLKGDLTEAERYFKDAISAQEQNSWIRAFIYYAELLEDRGRLKESRKILSKAMKLSEQGQQRLFRRDVLPALARIEKKIGNAKAVEALTREIEKESELGRMADEGSPVAHLRLKYDLERADNELARRNAELKEKQTQVVMLVWGVAGAAVIIILVVVMYRRKEKLHSSIVRQAVESARREASLQTAVANLEQQLDACQESPYAEEEPCLEPEPPSQSCGPTQDGMQTQTETDGDSGNSIDDRTARLQARFEALMLNKDIYSYNMITKEKIARQLGTNRTYLSQMINTVYGMSFTDFINSLRIKEAIRILSNPADDTPLKDIAHSLGYNSISTFYSNFKDETGMTPAAFRQRAKKM